MKCLFILSALMMANFANAFTPIVNIDQLIGHKMHNVKGDSISISNQGVVTIILSDDDDSSKIIGQLVVHRDHADVFTVEGKGIARNTLILQAFSLNTQEAREYSYVTGDPTRTLVVVRSSLDPEGRSIELAE